MSKPITNDSISNDSCESKEICVAAPKGMTWADLGEKGFKLAKMGVGYAYYPGVVYGKTALRRAGELTGPIYAPSMPYQINMAFAALGASIGLLVAGSVSFVTLPVVAAGIVIGAAAGPFLAWNTLGVVMGAGCDIRMLYRKAANAELPHRIAKRVNGFIHSPIRDTLGLRK